MSSGTIPGVSLVMPLYLHRFLIPKAAGTRTASLFRVVCFLEIVRVWHGAVDTVPRLVLTPNQESSQS